MKVTIYLEYEDDISSNDYENYYNDENSYIKALEESYNQTKDTIYESMNNGFTSDLRNRNGTFNAFSMFTNKVSKKEEKHLYTSCESIIYNEDKKELLVDDLVDYMIKEASYINLFDINLDTSEEEFETEFKMWYKSSSNIGSVNSNNAKWVHEHKPKRDIKVKFINSKGNECFALLKNCYINEKIDNLYSITIEKISFIKDLNE